MRRVCRKAGLRPAVGGAGSLYRSTENTAVEHRAQRAPQRRLGDASEVESRGVIGLRAAFSLWRRAAASPLHPHHTPLRWPVENDAGRLVRAPREGESASRAPVVCVERAASISTRRVDVPSRERAATQREERYDISFKFAATLAFGVGLGGACGVASGQLFIPDSDGDRIMLFDSFDGSLINADLLTDQGAVGWQFSTPKEAIVVGDEVWISDQLEDAVLRFKASDLSFQGSITGGDGMSLDNIRGMGFDGDTVYVTNASGDFDDAVVKFKTDGTFDSFFSVPTTSVFDAEPFFGDLLISDTTNDTIDQYTTNGGFVSNFAGGLGFVQQLQILDDNSVIAVNGIDSPGIEGLYHFNSDGSLREFIDTAPIGGPVLRGGYLLDNGSYLLSTGDGIFTATANEGGGGFAFDLVLGDVSGQYITLIPAPGAAALLGVAGLVGIRRRR